MTETGQDGFDYGELLVVQHADFCGPCALTPVLDARAERRPWRLVDVSAGAPLPDLERVRGAIVLGGPMGVGDRGDLPWLDEEIARLGTWELPAFGICLGVQLMGAALGGRVTKRDVPEIGLLPLQRTEAGRSDPVFAGWPDGAAAFFMHDDEVDALPEGAEPMLTGSEGVAAWRAPDGRSYGVQFHPEVDAAQIGAWTRREVNRPRLERAGVDPAWLAEEATRRDAFLRAAGVSLVARWVDQIVGTDDPDPTRGRRARG